MSDQEQPPAEPVPATEEEQQEEEVDEMEQYTKLSDDDKRKEVSKLVAEGNKASALKKWEEGVAKYALALDVQRLLVGEFDPTMAPLLFAYGRALYELALSQQGVMGKEEVAKGTDPASVAEASASSSAQNGKFVFEGDGDEEEEEEGEEEGQGDGDEPEDDFNAAWEVLDVARTIYARQTEAMPPTEGREERLALSEVYLVLGDVSCETENFPQAVQDYKAALEIKKAHLPASARAIASAHYQLGCVLEFTPNGRAGALEHVQAALDGFKLRAAELANPKDGTDIAKFSPKEREAEAKDVAGLIGDIEARLEELRAAPDASDIVTQSIDHLLGGVGGAAAVDDKPVNDLTSMVKKKAPRRAPVRPENGEKRAADEPAAGEAKKAKLA